MKLSASIFTIASAIILAGATPLNMIYPRQTQIGNIIFAGNGCSPGTASPSVGIDGHAFNMIFDEFIAQVGPSSTPADNVRKCDVIFQLKCPDGNYKFGMNSRAFSGLETGNSVTLQTVITYPDGTSATSTRTRNGPEGNDYAINHSEFADKQFPCSRVWLPFKISQTITLNKGASNADAYWGLFAIDAGINLA